jgi:hypothetical protein
MLHRNSLLAKIEQVLETGQFITQAKELVITLSSQLKLLFCLLARTTAQRQPPVYSQ